MNALDWLKQNWVIAVIVVLAAWVLVGRMGWFSKPEPEDPAAPVLHPTVETWEQLVVKSKKPVLVDFWATWCGPCRMQGPIVTALAKELSATAVVAKVDVDQQGQLAGRFGISSIPSLLIFKDGKVVKSFLGVTSAETLRSALLNAAKTKQ